MTEKEYIEYLTKLENKTGVITKQDKKYILNIYVPNKLNSIARTSFNSLEKSKRFLFGLGITKFILKEGV